MTHVALGGGNAGDFAVTSDTCTGETVAPNGICLIGVRFSPSADGPRTATLTLSANLAPTGTHTAALTGNGVPASVAPDTPVPASVVATAVATAVAPAVAIAPAPVVAAPDTTPPAVAASARTTQKLATVLAKGLAVGLRADEAATFKVSLLLDATLAKRLKLKPPVGAATVRLTAAGSRRVTVRMSRTARRKLASQRRVKLTVAVLAKDTTGNAAGVITRAVTLRR